MISHRFCSSFWEVIFFLIFLKKDSAGPTGQVHLFATWVKKEWIEQLKAIAYEERKHYNEVLERALECYEKHWYNIADL